jgi:hypothetical protein
VADLKEKKDYRKPEVHTEKVTIGVFGCYGSDDGLSGDSQSRPVSFWNPFFRFCCN